MIERQLEKRDLRDYDIYIGFMKGRIGTPTPTAASGTIEELDDARSRFGKRRLPSEILFYFIGEPAGDVLEFKRRLERESFIYASARDTDEFERLVTQHLGDIVAHWRQLGKKIARARRFIQPVVGSLAVLTIVSAVYWYLELDRGGMQAVASASGGHEAIEAWRRHRTWMYFHEPEAQDLAHQRVITDLDEQTRRGQSASALGLLDEAVSAGVIEPKDADYARAVDWIAGQRLFEGIWASKPDDTTWSELPLSGVEHRALARHAARVSSGHDFMTWGSVEQRLAIALSLTDPQLLRALATSALDPKDERADRQEIREYIIRGPLDDVLSWLEGNVSRDLPGYVYEDVTSAARIRANFRLAVGLLDLHERGRTPHEFLDTDTSTLFGMPHDDGSTRAAITERFVQWIVPNQLDVDGNTLETILPYVDEAILTNGQRETATDRLLKWLEANEDVLDGRLAVEDALARLSVEASKSHLRKQLRGYLEETSHYGTGQRELLMRHMARVSDDAERDRLALAETTASAARRDGFDDTGVQAIYLRALAEDPTTHWALHTAHLRELLDRRAAAGKPRVEQFGSFPPLALAPDFEGFDQAFAAVVARLSPEQQLALFDAPDGEHRVAEFDGSLDRWMYLLERLAEAGISAPPPLVQWGLEQSYFTEHVHAQWMRALARAGGTAAREHLRRTLMASTAEQWYLLAVNGDVASLRQVATSIDGRGLGDLVAAIEVLDDDARREVLIAAIEARTDDSKALAWLLAPASTVGLRHERLLAVAMDGLTLDDPLDVSRSLTYIGATHPEEASGILTDATITSHLRQLLQDADGFSWIVVMQSFVLPKDFDPPLALLEILSDRAVMVAARSKEEGLFVGDLRIWVPVLPDLARTAPSKLIPVLESLFDRRAQVSGGEALPRPGVAYGAYCMWLAADAVGTLPQAERPLPPDFVWRAVKTGDPLEVRTGAAWLAAWAEQRSGAP